MRKSNQPNRQIRGSALVEPNDSNIHLSADHLPLAVRDLLGLSADNNGSVVIKREGLTTTMLAVLCTVLPSEFVIESQTNEVIELYNDINPNLLDIAFTPTKTQRKRRI